MKLVVACLAAALTIDVAPAEACSPPQTCSAQFCFAESGGVPEAVVEGVLVDVDELRSVMIDVKAAAGRPDLPVGLTTFLLDPSAMRSLFPEEEGKSVLLYVRQLRDGEYSVTGRIERQFLEGCFESNEISVADLAAIVSAPECREELNADQVPFDGCGDIDDTGCSAGGGSAGGLVLLALALIGVRRRR